MTNKTLQARLRARESQVTIDGHVFTIRRPKPAEMIGDQTRMDLVRRFVVGWDLTNADLIPGGVPDPEPFEPALFADWVEDNADLWAPLADAILAEWRTYVAAKDDTAKN